MSGSMVWDEVAVVEAVASVGVATRNISARVFLLVAHAPSRDGVNWITRKIQDRPRRESERPASASREDREGDGPLTDPGNCGHALDPMSQLPEWAVATPMLPSSLRDHSRSALRLRGYMLRCPACKAPLLPCAICETPTPPSKHCKRCGVKADIVVGGGDAGLKLILARDDVVRIQLRRCLFGDDDCHNGSSHSLNSRQNREQDSRRSGLWVERLGSYLRAKLQWYDRAVTELDIVRRDERKFRSSPRWMVTKLNPGSNENVVEVLDEDSAEDANDVGAEKRADEPEKTPEQAKTTTTAEEMDVDVIAVKRKRKRRSRAKKPDVPEAANPLEQGAGAERGSIQVLNPAAALKTRLAIMIPPQVVKKIAKNDNAIHPNPSQTPHPFPNQQQQQEQPQAGRSRPTSPLNAPAVQLQRPQGGPSRIANDRSALDLPPSPPNLAGRSTRKGKESRKGKEPAAPLPDVRTELKENEPARIARKGRLNEINQLRQDPPSKKKKKPVSEETKKQRAALIMALDPFGPPSRLRPTIPIANFHAEILEDLLADTRVACRRIRDREITGLENPLDLELSLPPVLGDIGIPPGVRDFVAWLEVVQQQVDSAFYSGRKEQMVATWSGSNAIARWLDEGWGDRGRPVRMAAAGEADGDDDGDCNGVRGVDDNVKSYSRGIWRRWCAFAHSLDEF